MESTSNRINEIDLLFSCVSHIYKKFHKHKQRERKRLGRPAWLTDATPLNVTIPDVVGPRMLVVERVFVELDPSWTPLEPVDFGFAMLVAVKVDPPGWPTKVAVCCPWQPPQEIVDVMVEKYVDRVLPV